MSWKQVAGRGTWLGAAVAALVLLAGLGVAALLLLRGAVPESAMRPLVWIAAGAACFNGGPAGVQTGGAGPPPRPQRCRRVVMVRCRGHWLYRPACTAPCGWRR